MTFTDGASDVWLEIPNGIADEDRNQQQASQWAAQARAEIAQQWAQSARDEITQSLPPGFGFDPSGMGAGTGSSAAATSAVGTQPSTSPRPLSAVTPAPSGLDEVQPGLPKAPRGPLNDISQFGQPGLSYDEALAACGPAAAARLASIFGNNIPLKVALDVAKEVGWTAAGGMNGVQNQKRLLDRLGIPATLDFAPDPAKIVSDAQSGNPVTISTPNHYFTVSDFDVQTGKYFVGKSGTAYRGGSEWMTMDQIRRLGGGINGALFVDAPTSPTPSVAALETGQTQRYEPRPLAATPAQPSNPFESIVQQAQQAVAPVGEAISSGAQQVGQQVGQSFQDVLSQARQAVGFTGEPTQPVQAPGFGFDPSNMQPGTALADGVPLRQDVRDLGQQPQPTVFDQAGQFLQEGGTSKPIGEALQGAGEQIAGSGINAARREFFPNITEPGHPLKVVGALAERMGTENPPTSREMAEAGIAIGGMTAPFGPAGKGGDDIAAMVGRYSADVRQGLEDFVREQAAAGRAPKEIGDTIFQWMRENPPPVSHPGGLVDNAPGGLSRTLARIHDEPIGPQRGQLSLGMMGEEVAVPIGGPEPFALDIRGPAGPQRGQFEMGLAGEQSRLPYGGPRPTGTEVLPSGAQRGQLFLEGGPPMGGARPTGSERMGPIGDLPGQKPLPGTPDTTSSLADKAMAVRYGSMLSSWYTHAQNIASNTGQAFTRPVRLASAGYVGEAGGAVRGYLEGIPDGLAAFWDVMKTGASAAHNLEKIEQVRPHPFGTGKVGRVMDVPTTLLAATDDFFKSIVYSGTIRSEATRLAKGDVATLQELLKSPTANMVREAQQQAKLATYTEDPGRIVNKILKLQRGLESPERLAVNFVVPFVRTPSNILRRGVGLTIQPLTGPVKIARAIKRGDSRAARLEAADTALASIVALGFAAKAATGELSGDGPTNAAERQQLIDQGWQAHSIKVGDRWIDYSWAGPLGIQMALIANTAEAAKQGKQGAPTDEQVLDIANRLKGVLLQQSFLRGIGDLFKNTQAGLAGNVASYLGSNIPFGGLVKDIAEARDPLARQADTGLSGVPQRVEERVPGLRETVRPDLTSLGESAVNPRAGGSPLRTSRERPDQTLQVLQQAGVTIPAVPKSIMFEGKSVSLTPDEQDAFSTMRGQLICRSVESLTAKPVFTTVSAERRAAALREAVLDGSEAARDWMLKRIGRIEIARRVPAASR